MLCVWMTPRVYDRMLPASTAITSAAQIQALAGMGSSKTSVKMERGRVRTCALKMLSDPLLTNMVSVF